MNEDEDMPVNPYTSITAYQEKIRTFYTFPPDAHEVYASWNLAGEVGEALSLLAKFTRDVEPEEADKVWNDYVLPNLRKEIGDIQFMVACFADAFEFDMAEIMAENIAKLESRAIRGTLAGSGDDR